MLLVVLSREPILSKAGWSDAAANTVMLLSDGCDPLLCPPHAHRIRAIARRVTRLVTRQLHADVRRLHDGYRGHAWFELQLVDRFAGEERDEAVRTGLDLNLRGDAVFDDASDDAGKSVARGLGDRNFGFGRPLGLREAGERGAVDQPLPAGAANGREAPVIDHASNSVRADAEHLGCLSETIVRHCSAKPSICQSSGDRC